MGWEIDQRLLAAVEFNEVENARNLLHAEPNLINTYDHQGRTPFHLAWESVQENLQMRELLLSQLPQYSLHLAALNGDLSAFHNSLSKGADPNGRIPTGHRPIHLATYRNQVDVMEELVARGAVVDVTNDEGGTPLHSAAWFGAIDAMEWLLQRRATLEASTKQGKTPLMSAVVAGRLDSVKFLIDHGANTQTKDIAGQTLLHQAATGTSVELLQYLIETGIPVDTTGALGWTPLHSAVVHSSSPEIVEALIRAGASPATRDKYGKTPLYWTVTFENAVLAETLSQNGVSGNLPDDDGETPLELAIREGKWEIAEILKRSGATYEMTIEMAILEKDRIALENLLDKNPNLVGEEFDTNLPLHFALAKGFLEGVLVLLDHGAKVDEKDCYGRTPLEVAVLEGDDTMLEALDAYEATCEVTAEIAAARGDLKALKMILAATTTPLLEGEQGRDILSKAVSHGRKNIVEFLIEEDVDWSNSDPLSGFTPVHHAAASGQVEVLQTLHSNGIDLNLPSFDGLYGLFGATNPGLISMFGDNRPIHAAILADQPQTSVYLNQTYHLQVIEPVAQRTPLHYAAMHNSPNVVEVLLKSGMDPAVKDRARKTPLNYARERGFKKVIDLLESGSEPSRP